MKKRKNYLHLLIMALGMALFLGMVMTVSASDEVMIDGVKYYLNEYKHTAIARIYDVRGDDLPTELHIPRKIKYNKEKYRVTNFKWSGSGEYSYMESGALDFAGNWKSDIVIPDKERSYHACLKKITFDKGVEVKGEAYGYEKLKWVILEDPNDLIQAKYNNCPKLKRLHIPAGMRGENSYDIKNCPSLKLTIDKNNKRLKMIGNAICSKSGGRLLNVVAGKKDYKVPKGITGIGPNAFWGDTTIETLHLGKANVRAAGLPKLRRIRVDRKGSKTDTFYWRMLDCCPAVSRVDLPESIRYIYYANGESGFDEAKYNPSIKHVYLYSKTLKKGDMKKISAQTTFHVRSKKVKKQLRKFGFKGNIVIEKDM